jgi:hypothetical protein
MTKANYAMFSAAGNGAVAAMVEQARELEGEVRTSFLRRTVLAISRTHPEVYDTAVRESIAMAFDDPTLAYWKLARGGD